jgi:hypothetical protein
MAPLRRSLSTALQPPSPPPPHTHTHTHSHTRTHTHSHTPAPFSSTPATRASTSPPPATWTTPSLWRSTPCRRHATPDACTAPARRSPGRVPCGCVCRLYCDHGQTCGAWRPVAVATPSPVLALPTPPHHCNARCCAGRQPGAQRGWLHRRPLPPPPHPTPPPLFTHPPTHPPAPPTPPPAVGMFSAAEVQEVVDIGYLNGLFVLARSIGFIGGWGSVGWNDGSISQTTDMQWGLVEGRGGGERRRGLEEQGREVKPGPGRQQLLWRCNQPALHRCAAGDCWRPLRRCIDAGRPSCPPCTLCVPSVTCLFSVVPPRRPCAGPEAAATASVQVPLGRGAVHQVRRDQARQVEEKEANLYYKAGCTSERGGELVLAGFRRRLLAAGCVAPRHHLTSARQEGAVMRCALHRLPPSISFARTSALSWPLPFPPSLAQQLNLTDCSARTPQALLHQILHRSFPMKTLVYTNFSCLTSVGGDGATTVRWWVIGQPPNEIHEGSKRQCGMQASRSTEQGMKWGAGVFTGTCVCSREAPQRKRASVARPSAAAWRSSAAQSRQRSQMASPASAPPASRQM